MLMTQPQKRKLTFKQKKFAKAYIEKDGNGIQAVKEAYPGHTTPNAQAVTASRLLNNANVQNELKAILEANGLTTELVVTELCKLVKDESPSERNKAIRTAVEVMGLIGKGSNVQVNVGQGLTSLDIDKIKSMLEVNNNKQEQKSIVTIDIPTT